MFSFVLLEFSKKKISENVRKMSKPLKKSQIVAKIAILKCYFFIES